jgi:hypothetical protein
MDDLDRRKLVAGILATSALLPAAAHAAPPATNAPAVNVKDPPFNARGDGSADDTAAIQAAIDECFGPVTAPHNRNPWLNRPLYFPPGRYRISAPLDITRLRGGHVFGAGRFATEIKQTAADASVFRTNGCEYSRFERMLLESSGSARVFDLDWDGARGGVAHQSNTFADIYFKNGAIGVDIGRRGHQGSENLFVNCFWEGFTVAGLKTSNFNALQNSIVGGNFQRCSRAVWVSSGSVPLIASTGFQESSDFDIKIDNSVYDTTNVIGSRTESRNFVTAINAHRVNLQGCSQTNYDKGDLVNTDSIATVTGCATRAGRIFAANGARITIEASQFDREDWIMPSNLNGRANIEISNVNFGEKRTLITRQRITAAGTFTYDVTRVQ